MTRTKNCSHLDKWCLMESSLVCRACDNVAEKIMTEKDIRDLLSTIHRELPTLSNYVFDYDPTQRYLRMKDDPSFQTKDVEDFDDEVPMSLVKAMKNARIIQNDAAACWMCTENASILSVPCSGPNCTAVAHPDCLHITCPTKAELTKIKASVRFYCETHKGLKKAHGKMVSDDTDDPACSICDQGVVERDRISCSFSDDCEVYHLQCLAFVSLRDNISATAFIKDTKFNCLSQEHCRPKFKGVADEVIFECMGESSAPSQASDGEEDEEEEEAKPREKRPAPVSPGAGPSSKRAAAAAAAASERFGVLFQEPVEATPGALARREAAVTATRAGLLDKIKEFKSSVTWWDLPRVVSILGEEPTQRACSGYLMLVVEPFFAAVKRALPSAAAYEAAEFLHPGSNTVLNAAILPYLTREAGAGGAADLSESEFGALLKAAFPQPSSFDAASGAVTVAGKALKMTLPRLDFFKRMEPQLNAVLISKRLVEIMEADDPKLLLTNQSAEYDANAARDALHKSLMHELYTRMKRHGNMLDFMKEEMAADLH